MTRLIDADAIDKRYVPIAPVLCGDDVHYEWVAFIEDINKLPTVDAETVWHGKWVNANEGRWNTCEVLKCSECGELDNRMYKTDKYCPNCGARMDKDRKEE